MITQAISAHVNSTSASNLMNDDALFGATPLPAAQHPFSSPAPCFRLLHNPSLCQLPIPPPSLAALFDVLATAYDFRCVQLDPPDVSQVGCNCFFQRHHRLLVEICHPASHVPLLLPVLC
jgi:hypothetical protein